MTQTEMKPEAAVSVADALSTRSQVGTHPVVAKQKGKAAKELTDLS